VEFLIVLAILLLVATVVSSPLRREWTTHRQESRDAEDLDAARELAELEAARDAKYREIRDAELDRRTGKLSEADYEAIDRTLRADAIKILRALDEAKDRLAATIGER
jgi:hypothetical protein